MGKSLDERAAEIAANGYRGDIRMPQDVAVRLEKAQKAPEFGARVAEDAGVEKSSLEYQLATNVLMKGKMKDYALGYASDGPAKMSSDDDDKRAAKVKEWTDSLLERYGKHLKGIDEIIDEVVKKVGFKCIADGLHHYERFARSMAWAIDGVRWKKREMDAVSKALKNTLEKAEPWVGGIEKAPEDVTMAAHKKITDINAEIESVNEKISAEIDPSAQLVLHNRLKDLYEQVAVAVMASEGLGLKTEDLIRDQPDPRFKGQDYGFHTPAPGSEPKIVYKSENTDIVIESETATAPESLVVEE